MIGSGSSSPRASGERGRLLRRAWRTLSPQERVDAIDAANRDSRAVLQGIRLAVTRALRMRPATVQGWPVRQLADASARIDVGDDLLAELLVAYHLTERVPLLSAFLDAAGVPHRDGVTDPEAVTPDLPAERVLAAADHVLEEFPEDACRVYFATLVALEGGAWEPLRERLEPAGGEAR